MSFKYSKTLKQGVKDPINELSLSSCHLPTSGSALLGGSIPLDDL